jgi:hypothetical protein
MQSKKFGKTMTDFKTPQQVQELLVFQNYFLMLLTTNKNSINTDILSFKWLNDQLLKETLLSNTVKTKTSLLSTQNVVIAKVNKVYFSEMRRISNLKQQSLF